MTRHVFRIIIGNLMLATLLFPLCSFSVDEDEADEGSHCRPLHFGAIAPGLTKREQVIRSLGQGFQLKNNPGNEVLYFTDTDEQLSLYVAIEKNGEVKELTLREGVLNTLSDNDSRKAQTIYMSTGEGFGKGHALHLGDTKEAARTNLGAPAKGSKENEWKYAFALDCKEPEYETLYFKNQRIVKVVFSEPED